MIKGKAFCVELNRYVNPYEARELYFSEDSEYYMKKLTFICNENGCNQELIGVGVYNKEKIKKSLHFRLKNKEKHTCCSEVDEEENVEIEKRKGNSIEHSKKENTFPMELIIAQTYKNKKTFEKLEKEQIVESQLDIEKTSESAIAKSFKSESKTRYFDWVIDIYESEKDKEKLKQMPLKIGKKTKNYYSYFKKIVYHQDEDGLIYYGQIYGPIECKTKWVVYFKGKIREKENKVPIYLTIDKTNIELYGKKKQFLDELKEIKNSQKETVCYFVGASIEKIEYTSKESQEKEAYSVKIDNLDYLSFRMEDGDESSK